MRSFFLHQTGTEQQPAEETEGSASGAAAGGGKEGTRWGLAVASHGRAWPWPAKQQAAAAHQLSSARTALPAAARVHGGSERAVGLGYD